MNIDHVLCAKDQLSAGGRKCNTGGGAAGCLCVQLFNTGGVK